MGGNLFFFDIQRPGSARAPPPRSMRACVYVCLYVFMVPLLPVSPRVQSIRVFPHTHTLSLSHTHNSMFLRSGRLVGRPSFCRLCQQYYARPHSVYCSSCPEHPPHRFDDPAFQAELKTWVDKQLANTLPATRYHVQKLYMLGAQNRKVQFLKDAHALADEHNVFVRACFAQEVLETFGHEENMSVSHAILPRVIDWWHIRSFGTPAQKCYYARFDDDLSHVITHIPPPPPTQPMA